MKIFTSSLFNILLLFFIVNMLSGCAQNKVAKVNTTAEVENDKINVVSTIFAPYDFVREIAGEQVETTMLLPPGSESHSYEPTPQDIIKIQNSDIFVYVGGDSDIWVDGILNSMDTSKMKIIKLMDSVETVVEELVEGMEDDEHDHNHSDTEEFDPNNVKERPMSDFNGDWISGIPLISDGSLNDYIKDNAIENNLSFEEERDSLLIRWTSDYDNINIEDNILTINNDSSEYEYAGYEIIESDNGISVWYKYQIVNSTENMPNYITFNDHNYNSEEVSDGHDEEHKEIEHFHFKYGDDSFDTLFDNNNWSTFYFDASFSNSEIGEFMAHHEESRELDEHVWTSPKNAKLIVQDISDVLCELDTANSKIYRENTVSYITQLDELDKNFQELIDSSVRNTIIFGDRFPFRYFADAYDLNYFAAFPGCSTETEPSAATVAFLIDKINEENIPVVFHIELSNEKMANTISEATGAKVLLLHACHNVTKDEIASGVSYLTLMNQNVSNLKEALY